MESSFAWHLILILLFMVARLASRSFAAATPLAQASSAGGSHDVEIFSVTPDSTNVADQRDLWEEAIWLAVNALLPSYYPQSTPWQVAAQFTPRTIVDGAITFTVRPGEMPTPLWTASSVISTSAIPTESSWTNTFFPTTSVSTTSSSTPSSTKSTSTKSSTTMTTTTSTTSKTTSTTMNTTTRPSETVPAVPTSTHRPGNGDLAAGIGIGTSLSALAIGLLIAVLLLVWRRKRTTGDYFKPVRYSQAYMVGQAGEDSKTTMLMSPSGAGVGEKRRSVLRSSFVPSSMSRMQSSSTIRAVAQSNPVTPTREAVTPTNRRSVERLRERQLVSNGVWNQTSAQELEGTPVQRVELEGSTTPNITRCRGSSDSSSNSGASTPTLRPLPLFAARNLTTSSLDVLESRGESRGESLGESLDEIAPLEQPPLPTYRKRRPELRLPLTPSRGIRDQPIPLVYFREESPSPEAPSVFSNRRSVTTAPSTVGSGSPERYSPLLGRRPVHYPSWSERSTFDFGDLNPISDGDGTSGRQESGVV